MGSQVKNTSFDNQPIEIKMDSRYLVLIDPLALDGLSEKLSSNPNPIATNPIELLAQYSEPLRIGMYEIPDFIPGDYQISSSDLTSAESDDKSSEIVDIDIGEMIVVDFSHLSDVAKNLAWEQYDLYLQSPVGDDTVILSIIEKIGGAYFGIISSDENTEFIGDGSYKIRHGTAIRLAH